MFVCIPVSHGMHACSCLRICVHVWTWGNINFWPMEKVTTDELISEWWERISFRCNQTLVYTFTRTHLQLSIWTANEIVCLCLLQLQVIILCPGAMEYYYFLSRHLSVPAPPLQSAALIYCHYGNMHSLVFSACIWAWSSCCETAPQTDDNSEMNWC